MSPFLHSRELRWGREIATRLSKDLSIDIPTDEATLKVLEKAVHDLALNWDYGYCPDCEERMPDEPLRNEGAD